MTLLPRLESIHIYDRTFKISAALGQIQHANPLYTAKPSHATDEILKENVMFLCFIKLHAMPGDQLNITSRKHRGNDA
jgi:hypothetical protein